MKNIDLKIILKWTFKLAGVLVTSPATYLAASQFARHYESTSLRIGAFVVDPVQMTVELAAVILVEGIFLYSWLNLENNGNVGSRAGDVAFAWAMFFVIFSIAVTQGEVEAVIIRAPIAIMLARETWDNIVSVVTSFMPAHKEDDEKTDAEREPMLVRFYNWWIGIKEEIKYRREQYKAFRQLSKARVAMHRERIEGELQNVKLDNAYRNERMSREIERMRQAKDMGTVDDSGEVLLNTTDALKYLKSNGLERSGAWLRNLAKDNERLGRKSNGAWLFVKTELDKLL